MVFKKYSLVVDEETYKAIKNIAQSSKKSMADVSRKLLKKGIEQQLTENNIDYVSQIIRKQMEIVLKPHTERLAKISSKTGHMAATSTFLNVQAFMDLVPDKNRKNVLELYENARKKAVEYMKSKTEDLNLNLENKEGD